MRLAVVPLALAMLAVTCTAGQSTGPVVREPDPRARGTVLVREGFGGGSLELLELPDGIKTPVRSVAGRVIGASFDAQGRIVAGVSTFGGRFRMYRLSVDEHPIGLGPALPGGDTVSFGGGRVAVTYCGPRPFARVLDLSRPDRWLETPAGCGATLSPDGSSLAWSPDGGSILTVDLSGLPKTVVAARIEDVPLPDAVSGEASFFPPVAQGHDAAALVSTTGWQGVAVGIADPALYVLGDRGSGPPIAYLEWQPGGSLLAVASSTTQGGMVRILGGEQGSTVAAIFGGPATGVVWSPTGDALLACSDSVWAIVSPEGDWLWSSFAERGQEPLDWWTG